MSAVIGLAVASDEVRAVYVHDGTARWAGRASRSTDVTLADEIAALLAAAPRSRWRRPPVIAAVGPAAAQVKRLTGLPPIESPAALGALVREGAGRFFLRNGIPLKTSGVRIDGPGVVWAAAFDQPVVDEIERGVRAARLRLRGIIPAVVALAAVLADAAGRWHDGEVRTEFVVRAGVLASVRRIAADDRDLVPDAITLSALAQLGEEGWRFADAYGAARSSPHEAIALRPNGQDDASVSRRRLVLAGGSCVAAALLAAVAPGVTSVLQHARATRELLALAPRAHDAAAAQHELQGITRALAEAETFAARRRSPTALLASLTRALPAGAAMVALRMDSAGGTIVLLAPRAAPAIAALDSVPGISGPEVIGPVTKEMVGMREVERVTVRYHTPQEPAP